MNQEAHPDGADLDVPPVQKVGYCNTPVEHRYKKGQSGNPAGRPRGAKNKTFQMPDPATLPTGRMILEEAYRSVQVREGDKLCEIPTIQAVVRSLAVAAMKGNRLSQKTLTETVQREEAAERALRDANFDGARDYIARARAEIEEAKRLGLPEPLLLPHPDDVVLHVRSGSFSTIGPVDEQEKAQVDKLIEDRAGAQAEVTMYAKEYRDATEPGMKEFYLREWLDEQKIFDMINDVMQERNKATLVDRSLHPDASREGFGMAKHIEERAQRPKKRRVAPS
jgi:hypothetical protein